MPRFKTLTVRVITADWGELATAADGLKALNEAYKLGLNLDMSEDDAATLPANQQQTLADAQAYDKAQRAYNLTHNINYIAGAQYVHNFDRLWFMPRVLLWGPNIATTALKTTRWATTA